jgi:hypothetical protein
MGFVFIFISVIIAVAFINHQIKENKKRKGEDVIKEIQRLYLHLNDIVIPIYQFKNCPKCGKNLMNIRRILPSGKSIEYSCEYCEEVIKSSLITGKDPYEALDVQNAIKQKMEQLNSLIGDEVFNKDIDITFIINSQ